PAMNLWLGPEDEERLADLYARSLRRFQHDRTLKELTERKQALEDAFEQERAPGHIAREEVWEHAAELSRVDYELRRARRTATVEARRTVEGLARVLERYDYLRDARPTPKAPYLRSLFDTNALTLSELLTNQQLEGLEPAELAEALSWFSVDRESAIRGLPLTRRLHRRGVVQASYQWAVGGLPEVSDDTVEDWDVRILPEDEPSAGLIAALDNRPRRRIPAFVKRRGAGASTSTRHRPAVGRRRK